MSYRSHNCGELRLSDAGKTVKLSGWVQIGRDFGGLPGGRRRLTLGRGGRPVDAAIT